MSASKPLMLTTAALHSAALSSLSLPPPPPPGCPLTSPPASLPYSKLIPRTRFIVDGFKHADPNFSVSYFLSHFHSDHYTGLSPQWTSGIIYCSATTATLLHQILNIPQQLIFPLPLAQTVLIDGSQVWLVDANHCPGAVQFLFKVPASCGGGAGSSSGSIVRFDKYVHTGDFRYSEEMKNESVISEFVGADAVFLDTTYCNPKFVFPSQEESIDYIVGVIERLGVENAGVTAKNVLFLVATYVIGKERILVEISRRCKRKIHVSGRKMAVLCALGLGETGVFTLDESESDVHVVGWNVLGETWPYFRPNFMKISEIMSERGYSKVVGFVPTGWTYEVKRNKFSVRTKDSFEIHLVPYSEHSNYDELRAYVKFLKPKRVIPTVGADVENIDSKHANAMQKHFAGLVDEMAIKQEFLMSFLRAGTKAVDVGKDSPFRSDDVIMEDKKDAPCSASHCCTDVEQESDRRSPFPQQEHAQCDSEDIRKDCLEKSAQELRDCLPIWVTLSQILDLLDSSGGNVIEAASNFYEHETEFHEQVLPGALVSCASAEGPENQPASPIKSIVKTNHSETVSLSQSFKLSSPKNIKKSANSPGKRKRNLDSKGTKKARVGLTRNVNDSKQYTITKFFKNKMPVVPEETKVEVEFTDDKRKFPTEVTELNKEEVNQFIQLVNGGESLRSYAATLLEKTKGDINMALDTYYNNNASTANDIKDNLLGSNKFKESECTSIISSMEGDAEQSERKNLEIKSDILFPTLSKDNLSVDYVSLPPDRYSPIEHESFPACWRKGQPAPYIHIARTFDLVKEEKGKIKATSMLCNMFRSLLVLSPEDVLPAVYLCTNRIAPEHENTELNIGGGIVISALEEACGTNRSKIKTLYDSLGDLGDVAQLCRQTQSLLAPPAALTIRQVYSILQKISVQTGSGSTSRKKSLIVNLMCSCREKEMKFLVRTLVRNLRIGAMMRTILPALAQAIVINYEGAAENLKEDIQRLSSAVVDAYNKIPNLDILIPSLMEKGIQFSSSAISMVPGIPIKPMLAKITNGVLEVLKIFQNRAFTCEYKYDGQRAQIHRLADGSIRVFSRNGDETTSRFPDLVEIVLDSCVNASVTFILDTEVVAIDRKNGRRLMSFQELSTRERGSKDSLVDLDKIKVDICVFVFDIMFASGEQLLDLPLRARRKYLRDLFGEERPGYFEYAKEMTVEPQDADSNNETTTNRMSSFLSDAIYSSCEGIMVKSLDVDSGYAPSKRSDAWLKVKRDYVEGLSDSLDLVPIGAWYGNGRKAGWFSPFLMACYNPDTEEFQSVCRVMSGFSDAFYKEMKDFFSGERIMSKRPAYYRTAEVADMWFSAEVVWQIKGADLTLSPVHDAAFGLVHPSRGISVRFPRFIRSLMDRKPEDCTTASDIADMFTLQTRKMEI
ncbi:DNA ligase 6 isoform X2 [Salvia miltiorrhiza]|uniref:DNA ligase 6 isoform X2 n=1 Tax=Salvia miltiorrhiza TaxID=226208 RepID=UPI0025AC3073|nr:DNA ligase 6 isoform X2 [Salvia miltiorrhiza]